MKKILTKKLPSEVFHVFLVFSVFLILFLLNAVYSPAVFGEEDNSSTEDTGVLSDSGAAEMPFLDIPGTIDGEGTYFEITDSDYLDITLESSEEMELLLESIPQMITITIEPSNTAQTTQITLSGFEPLTTYYKYEDNYHNETKFTTNSNGSYTYTQDISQNHFVFIQPRKSTKFIADDSTGGDCTSIGNWDNSTKTCTLTTDLNESIQIDSDGITLDGNGHTNIGTGTGIGILVSQLKDVVVKNLSLDHYTDGISLIETTNSTIFANNLLSNMRRAILINGFSDNIAVDSNIIGVNRFSLVVIDSSNVAIVDNFLTSGDTAISRVITLSNSTDSVILNNNIDGGSITIPLAIHLIDSANNFIAGNQISASWALAFSGSSSANKAFNNSFINTSRGVLLLAATSNNEIYNNNFINSSIPIEDSSSGSNIFNLSGPVGGNYFSNYDTPAEGCNDINSDNFCDDPFVFTGGQDNLPWTFQDGWPTTKLKPQLFNLGQNNSDDTTPVPEGGIITEDQITFKAILISLQNDNVKLQVELREFNEPFTGNFDGGILESSFVPSGQEATITRPGLVDGEYHWRARAVDTNGNTSEWQEFGTEGNVDFEVDIVQEPAVLFLPGVLGSRLDIGSNRLWEPNTEADVEKLYLNAQGKSINNVEVGGAIDEYFGLSGLENIYKSFLNDLEDKKAEGTISDYSVATYDWRLSMPDILNEGDIEQKLRDLASGSGKVTIVAHSNGGLVAKALINELGTEAPDLIDKVVFVAVPQIGTPKTVGTLFHGYDVGIPHSSFPFILDPELARDFANNAPFAYHLLPHPDYYSNTGADIQTNIASFQVGEATQQFIDKYGTEIDITSELYQFIIGEEGRSDPAFEDLEEPKIGNSLLLDQALSYIQGIGSSWQPPAGIDIHQIAGIGEDTLAGINYTSVRECINLLLLTTDFNPICLEYEQQLSYTPNEVIDGDNTVVAPSALVMSDTASNVNRWWLDLKSFNEPIIGVNRKHADILEVDELRAFIFGNLITELVPETIFPEFISNSKPVIDKGNRLRFVLHSPLELSVTDKDGNELGELVSDIPEGRYTRYGEVQVITLPADSFPTLNLEGTAEGTFTLEIEQYSNETLVSTTTFSGIISFTGTIATMDFSDGTIENAGDLQLDFEGDSTIDLSIVPQEGEEVVMPEPTISQLIEALNQLIQDLPLQSPVKKQLFNITSTIERQFDNQESQIIELTEQIENLQNKPNSQKAIDALQQRIDDLEQKRTEAKAVLIDAAIIFKEHTEKNEISSRELVGLTRTLLKVLQELR